MQELIDKLSTVVSVQVTPFDAQLKIDYDALKQNLSFALSNEIRVLTIGGNTGEFYSLSSQEYRDIMALACEQLKGRATVIAGVGFDVDSAIASARFAEECGADALMIHHPANPFVGARGYVDYVRAIADAVRIGVIPYVRAGNIKDAALLEALHIENVVAVKYAVNDLPKFSRLVQQAPRDKRIAWICGSAEAWAPFFSAAGASGFTSGMVNVAPKLSLKLLRALQQHNHAAVRDLHALILPFEDLRAANSSELNVSAVKEAMCQLKLGPREVRPPAQTLSADECATVSKILQTWREFLQ